MKTINHMLAGTRRGGLLRGFSLVEVMIAIGILGLGLIMVACIFPVGADWTRQNADETIAAQVARSAVALIQVKYTSADLTSAFVGTTVQGIPGLANNPPKLTIYERAFQFGPPSNTLAQPTVNENGNPATAQFFWAALIRATPGTVLGTAASPRQYDLYILVSKKGDKNQTFATDDLASRGSGEPFVPGVASGQFNAIPMGAQAIGLKSGTVFRKIGTTNDATGNNAHITLTLMNENFAYVLPADGTYTTPGTGVSPLVYIYQTKLSF